MGQGGVPHLLLTKIHFLDRFVKIQSSAILLGLTAGLLIHGIYFIEMECVCHCVRVCVM